MLNIDVHIERIQNGFIVTGHDSSRSKRYFRSLEDFVMSDILQPAIEEDRYFREHDTDGMWFELRAFASSHNRP